MKTEENFKQYYDDVLLPELKSLEVVRIKIANEIKYFVFILICIFCVLLVLFCLSIPFLAPAFLILLPFAIFLVFGSIVYFVLPIVDYMDEFNNNIPQKILYFIDKTLKYSKNCHISKEDFVASKIFKRKPDNVNGSNYASGKLGTAQIKFSKIHAKYNTYDSVETAFKGLFFVAKSDTGLKSETVVFPPIKKEVRSTKRSIRKDWNLISNVTLFNLIELADPEFERLFTVYSNDQIEAPRILSSSMRKKFIAFKEKTDADLYLSFIGSKIYVAISFCDPFEPRIFKTLLNFEEVKKYFENFQLSFDFLSEILEETNSRS